MANPFDALITADVLRQPFIGAGSNGRVFAHPNDPSMVIKIPHEGVEMPASINPTPFKSIHEGIGSGLPVAKQTLPNGKDIEIMPKVEGRPSTFYYSKMRRDDSGNKYYIDDKRLEFERIRHLNSLRKMPDDAYIDMRTKVKALADMGYNWDPKPSNTIINQKAGRFELIDLPQQKSANPIPWSAEPTKTSEYSPPSENSQRRWIQGNLQVPEDSPVGSKMTPRQQSAAKAMHNIILNKLKMASKVVPALGIPEMFKTGGRVQNVVQGKTSPMQEYADMLGLETYDPRKDYL